jgi:hypothetical protein
VAYRKGTTRAGVVVVYVMSAVLPGQEPYQAFQETVFLVAEWHHQNLA